MGSVLHSKISGNGEKHLLIFHGLFGQSDNWATLSKRYAEKYTVHAIDLRNHGRSFHSDEMSFTAMTADILNYLNHHAIPSCYLLGHSLGGRSVIEFSFAHPEKVDKLIVVDMAPKAYPPHHQGIIKALNSVDFEKVEKRSDVEEVLKQYIPETGTRQFLLKNVYHVENGKYAFRFNLKTLTGSYGEMVGTDLSGEVFDKPALFLRGDRSDYIQDEDFDLIRRHFPQAEIQTVSNAGHWIHAENPLEFYEKTIEFLESHDAASA